MKNEAARDAGEPQAAAVPRVSVVVTCYNYGRFLRQAVASALAQTSGELEVIIVDDGSTDDTPNIASTLAGEPRVRYVRQANAGQAAAKNRGIAEARGELVAFLDADDAWAPEKLARQLPLLDNPAVGVVYSDRQRMNEEGRPAFTPRFHGHGSPRRGRITRHLLFDNFIPFSSSVARRQALLQAGGFKEDLAMAIDWDLWLRVSLDWEFDYVAAPLLHYRAGHADQMSRKLDIRHACCDRIFETFVRDHADALEPRDIRRARAYTHRIRALPFERSDPRRAIRGYLRSLRLDPFVRWPYGGLLRALFALRGGGAAAGR